MLNQFGLGNFLYTLDVQNGTANFKFVDPDDANNTAEVSVAKKDFPEGAPADSRQVADYAYAQCSKILNDKRDERLHRQASKDLAEKQEEDRRSREAGEDFVRDARDVAVEPARVDEDGTRVYNTAPADQSNNGGEKKK